MSTITFSEKRHGIIDFQREEVSCRLWIRFSLMMVIFFDEEKFVMEVRFLYFAPNGDIQHVNAPGIGQGVHTVRLLRERGYDVVIPFATRYPIQINLHILKQNLMVPPEASPNTMTVIPVTRHVFTALVHKDGEFLFYDSNTNLFHKVAPQELIEKEGTYYKHRIICDSANGEHHAGMYCSDMLACKSEKCACRGMGFKAKCLHCNLMYHTCPYGCELTPRIPEKRSKGFAYTHERINTHINLSQKHKNHHFTGETWEYEPYTTEDPYSISILERAKKIADTIKPEDSFPIHIYFSGLLNAAIR